MKRKNKLRNKKIYLMTVGEVRRRLEYLCMRKKSDSIFSVNLRDNIKIRCKNNRG